MSRTYKIVASQAEEIIFDSRVTATTPRQAREEMKTLLGLQSLSGIVYAITEIPVDLIREIVDARIAELVNGAPLPTPAPTDLYVTVMDCLAPILQRLVALEQSSPPAPVPQRFDPLAESPSEEATDEEPSETSDQVPWMMVRRHWRRYHNPTRTAELYQLDLDALETRAREEGW